jgi:gas vesicle protein
MNPKSFFVGAFAGGFLAASAVLVPSVGHAQADARVAKSMETLKAMTVKLGAEGGS